MCHTVLSVSSLCGGTKQVRHSITRNSCDLFIAGGGRVVQWAWVNFQCRGILLIWIRVGQGPTALAFSPLSPSLRETARYRLKYCLKGPLNPNQPTNQHMKQTISQKLLFRLDIGCCCLTLRKHKNDNSQELCMNSDQYCIT